MSKVLVICATGHVGRPTMDSLVRAGADVRAGSRDPNRISAPPSVERVRFDYSVPDTFDPALEGVDRVFVMAPPGVSAPQKTLAPFLDVATKRVQKIVLLSAAGVEADDNIPLRQIELQIERSGVKFVHLRANWFMDNFHSLFQQPIKKDGVLAVPAADAKTAFIDARDIGACASACFMTDKFDNKGYTLSGIEAYSYGEAAAILSQAAGREIRYTPVDDNTFITSLTEAGLSPSYAAMITSLFAIVRAGHAAATSNVVEELTGRPARTLTEYARNHAGAWRLPTPPAAS